MIKITSASNPKIKYFFSLKLKKNIIKEKKFMIEGENIINEGFRNNIVEILLITKENLFKDKKVEKILVNNSIIKKLSSSNTNIGAIAICKYHQLEVDFNKLNKIILLDQISNPKNLGAIIRTAKAFEFDAIFLYNDSTFYLNQETIRSSQGMLFDFPILKINDLNKFKDFKKYFFVLEKDSKNLKEIKVKNNQKTLLIFGNEKNGISKEILNNIEGEKIFIRINPKVESLNLASSVSIALHYFNNY